MSTDDKFGIADRLRDSAALIRDQIGGGGGDAVYLDLGLMADEIEELENSFEEKGEKSFLTFGDANDLDSVRRDLMQQGVGMLNQAVHPVVVGDGDTSRRTGWVPPEAQKIIDESLGILDKLINKEEDKT